MRIHLKLEASLFSGQPVAGPSSGPLAQLGGEVVLIELQGELRYENAEHGGVVGVIGLDRSDKPTLHLGEHHLLHGKFVNLPKPLAVIRRGTAFSATKDQQANAVEGDADEEEEDALAEELSAEPKTPAKSATRKGKERLAENAGDDEPLFPPDPDAHLFHTPVNGRHSNGHAASSSPLIPPSTIRDYSSELDFSSPARSTGSKRSRDDDENEEDDGGIEEDMAQREGEEEQENEEDRRKRLKIEAKRTERRAMRPARTRTYEVVGLVRRKVVFALR